MWLYLLAPLAAHAVWISWLFLAQNRLQIFSLLFYSDILFYMGTLCTHAIQISRKEWVMICRCCYYLRMIFSHQKGTPTVLQLHMYIYSYMYMYREIYAGFNRREDFALHSHYQFSIDCTLRLECEHSNCSGWLHTSVLTINVPVL